MKDIVISSKRRKAEIITWIVCFVVANLANLYAIITYSNTSFWELLTSLGYVLIASFVLYALWSVVRIVFYAIKKILNKRQ